MNPTSSTPADGDQQPAPVSSDPDTSGEFSAVPVAPSAAASTPTRRARTRWIAASVAGATAIGAIAGVGGWSLGSAAAAQTAAEQTAVEPAYLPGRSAPDAPRYGTFDGGSGTTSESTQTEPVAATAEQMAGVVTIDTDLYYGAGEAAGTGMVVTSDGTVLTNNHVIQGATTIEVTIESTGETFSADVVGYDDENDVAVLQLEGASGLDTVTLDADEQVAVGDAVTSVGNAEGTGDLVAAVGTVSALDQSIDVQDELDGSTESLDSLLQLDVYVVSGDSGGPLLDDEGEVVGIVTAASSGTSVVTGFAITIDEAVAIWQQVESGVETETVQLGSPAYLGVTLQSATTARGGATAVSGGALIGGVLEDSPAAAAGLTAGDTVTALDGGAIDSGDALRAAIASHDSGDTVTLTITRATGEVADVTVTLGDS